jgi:[acyl-carrier-protein] S-malonyltransferase
VGLRGDQAVRKHGLGLLFPGQGSQYVGMGRDLAERFPVARQVFEEADEVLGFPLSRICWEGPEEELVLTNNAQPAILTHSFAVWRLLRDHEADVAIAAGHSLGEFSAYGAAGTFEFTDVVRTVRLRGELMLRSGEARPGAMAAVLGLADAELESVCREASGAARDEVVVPANFNAPGQVVISGDRAAVERAGDLARQAGARRVVPLNVSGAFHSPLMAVASGGLDDQLRSVTLRQPRFPVVSNVTAGEASDPVEIRRLLVEQLTSPVRWVASVSRMLTTGASRFLELGPGSVLGGLVKRVDRAVEVIPVGTADQVESLLSREDPWVS